MSDFFSMSRIFLRPEDDLTGAFVVTRGCSPREFRIRILRDSNYTQWTLFSSLEDHEDLVYLLCWIIPYAKTAFLESVTANPALRAIQRGLVQYLAKSRIEPGSFIPTQEALAALNGIDREVRFWTDESKLRGGIRHGDSESSRTGINVKECWETVQVVLVGLINSAKQHLGDQSYIRLPADDWRNV